jgi:hypothetical protein
MRVFPKVFLRWHEPRALRLAGHKENKRTLARIVPIATVAALVLGAVAYGFAPEVIGRLFAALGLVILFMYATLWVYRVFPSCVQVSEKGISQCVTSDDGTTWRYEAIDHCEIGTADTDGISVRVLTIETRRGERSTIGIADSVSTESLRATLADRGVRVISTAE